MNEMHICKKENLTRRSPGESPAPEMMKSLRVFDRATLVSEGLSEKQKALLAVAVALTSQCPHCIESHSERARATGVTDAEMFEVAIFVAAFQADAGAMHMTHAGRSQSGKFFYHCPQCSTGDRAVPSATESGKRA
jgi:AhpD family alkylhydroperoxidase